ncbi:MAG: hypothetical protein ACLSUW_09985 [Akkermansia sp.]
MTSRTAQNIFAARVQVEQARSPYALHLWMITSLTGITEDDGYLMMKEICQFWESQLKVMNEGGSNFRTEDKKVTRMVSRDLPISGGHAGGSHGVVSGTRAEGRRLCP